MAEREPPLLLRNSHELRGFVHVEKLRQPTVQLGRWEGSAGIVRHVSFAAQVPKKTPQRGELARERALGVPSLMEFRQEFAQE